MRRILRMIIPFLAVMLLFVAVAPLKTAKAASALARFMSDVSELGPQNAVGRKFKVAIVLENLENLYAFDIRLNWTSQWICCLTHVTTVPAQQYPVSNPPSPYSGVLNTPTLKIKDEVNESKSISGAGPDAMAWFVYSSMVPAAPFFGNGTVAVFEFEVVEQPSAPENATVVFHFVGVELSDTYAHPIPVVPIDLMVPLFGREGFNIKIEDVQHADTVCYEHKLYINVFVTNYGQYIQTVNLIAYVNGETVNTTTITLGNHTTNDTICAWDTMGYDLGTYNISVHAVPILGESNTTDNTFDAAPVTIKVMGDVDGDLDVDIYDIVSITSIYGVKRGDPRFNENSDLDNDGAITIYDVVTCAAYYGTKYP